MDKGKEWVKNPNKLQLMSFRDCLSLCLTWSASTLASCSCMWLAEPGRGNRWNGLGAELLPPADAGGEVEEAACADDDRAWPDGLVELSADGWPCGWCGWWPPPCGGGWCGGWPWCLSSPRPLAEAVRGNTHYDLSRTVYVG